jgi:hypothetical protein
MASRLPQHHRQQRNLCRSDALDAGGLAEGGGADLGEAELGFFFQAVTSGGEELVVVFEVEDAVAALAGEFMEDAELLKL